MARTVKYDLVLSGKSFRQAARKIRAYRKTLEAQCQRFVDELAQVGYDVIEATLAEHMDTGETINSLVKIVDGGNGTYIAQVQVTSDAIMFLEFGSGLIGIGTAEHAADFGYGSGTYEPKAPRQNPEYDNWENPDGWWYYGEDGHSHKSYGMVASMPMLKGGNAMVEQFTQIAKKVFR